MKKFFIKDLASMVENGDCNGVFTSKCQIVYCRWPALARPYT